MTCKYCRGTIYTSGTEHHLLTLSSCLVVVKDVPCTQCSQCLDSFFSEETQLTLENARLSLEVTCNSDSFINFQDLPS